MKLEAARIHFLSDVFVAVAVVGVYKLPVGFLGRRANLFKKVKKKKKKRFKNIRIRVDVAQSLFFSLLVVLS